MNPPIKIGVALGSGSARGWSHIGVLKELRALGVEPDVVAGTSIGALVGACYAADKLQALEDWVVGLGWRDVVSLLDVKFSGGLIEGRKVFQFFEDNMPELTFEQLTKSFAAVATDLESGREIWLQHGQLAEAVRSSISLRRLVSLSLSKNQIFIRKKTHQKRLAYLKMLFKMESKGLYFPLQRLYMEAPKITLLAKPILLILNLPMDQVN